MHATYALHRNVYHVMSVSAGIGEGAALSVGVEVDREMCFVKLICGDKIVNAIGVPETVGDNDSGDHACRSEHWEVEIGSPRVGLGA